MMEPVVVPVTVGDGDEAPLTDSGMNLLSVFRVMKPFIPKMRPLIKKNCEGSMLCTRVFQQSITVPILLAMAGAPRLTTDLSWLCVSFGATKPFYDTPELNSAFNWVCVFNTLVQKWEDHTTRCYECRRLHPFLESMAALADAFPAARGFIKKTSMIKWHAVLSQISAEIGCSVLEWVSNRFSSSPRIPSSSSSSSSSKAKQAKSTEGTVSKSQAHPNPLVTPTPLLVMQRGRSPASVAAANAAKKPAAPFHFLVAKKEPEGTSAASRGTNASDAQAGPCTAAPVRRVQVCDLCSQPVQSPTALLCTRREHLLCAQCRDGVLAAAGCLPVPLCPLCPDSSAVIDMQAEAVRTCLSVGDPEVTVPSQQQQQQHGESPSTLPQELQDQIREMEQLVAVMQGTRPRRRRTPHKGNSNGGGSGGGQQGHIDRCTAGLARTLHQMLSMSNTACWTAARRCLGMVDALIGMYGTPGLL